MTALLPLPQGVTVFERGWLSANNILLVGPDSTALVDSGYGTHAAQTVELVARALSGRPLDALLNTHLHSDHCGGNAALQARYPALQTWIPAGQFAQVNEWDPVALTYVPTGQLCPRFRADGMLRAGMDLELGWQRWQVHAAPGHDPHSIVLFEPVSRTLISADALWRHGFGVVFPELEGQEAFDEVGKTLDLIESLAPAVVIPGHGPVFEEVDAALAECRSRLAGFRKDPRKHARHAVKVLLKFKLLERQRFTRDELLQWAGDTAYLQTVRQRWFDDLELATWVGQLVSELESARALHVSGDAIMNSE